MTTISPANASDLTWSDFAPEPPVVSVPRTNVLDTLDALVESEAQIIVLEGQEGIGKTTVLHQFASRHNTTTFALFLSSASRWAYDPTQRAYELGEQLRQFLIRAGVNADPNEGVITLGAYIRSVHNVARRKRQRLYFVVDGLDEVPGEDTSGQQQILDLLPFGLDEFRFLLAGNANSLPLTPAARKKARAFQLAFLTQDESSRYLADMQMSDEEIAEVHRVTRGIPGYLSGVRRLLGAGVERSTILTSLHEQLPSMFELEWAAVKATSEQQLELIAILAHENRPYTAKKLGEISGQSADDVHRCLHSLTFLQWDRRGNIRFVSETHRKYAETRLPGWRQRINTLFIDHLLRSPEEDEALSMLPDYLATAERLADLVAYLSPERFARLYQKSPSLRLVQQKAELGIDAARRLNRDGDLIRFTIQRSTLEHIASSVIAAAEVRALTALGDYGHALQVVDSTPRQEEKFKLLAAIARAEKGAKDSVNPELLERIQTLYLDIDPTDPVLDAVETASDLMYVAPDLAIELVSRTSGNRGTENSLDWALAQLAVRAQFTQRAGTARDSVQLINDKITDPAIKRLSAQAVIQLGVYDAAAVIMQADRLDSTSDQLYVLRHWMLANRTRPDAVDVLEHALTKALRSTGYSPNALVYRELASCLPYVESIHKKQYYVEWIAGQLPALERTGPTQDIIRLQLTLARTEWQFDQTASRTRFLDVYNQVSKLEDPTIRIAAFARFVAVISRTDTQRILNDSDGLHDLVEHELQDEIDTILTMSGDHLDACRGAIEALAISQPHSARSIVNKLNIEPRRDAGFAAIATSHSEAPAEEIEPSHILNSLHRIVDPSVRDYAIEEVTFSLIMNRYSPELVRKHSALFLYVLQHRSAVWRVRLAATLLGRFDIKNTATELYDQLANGMRGAWDAIDADWQKLEIGYEAITLLAKNLPDVARIYVSEVNALKRQLSVYDSETDTAAVLALRLAIRAYAGLLLKKLDTVEDHERLVAAVQQTSSLGSQAVLFRDLALRYHVHGRTAECKEIVERFLLPTLLAIPEEDRANRDAHIISCMPALYFGARASALNLLRDLDDYGRDHALQDVADLVYTKLPPGEPYEPGPRGGYDINFADITSVIDLLEQMTSDTNIYYNIEHIADSISNTRYASNLNRGQRAEIVRLLQTLATRKFPSSRFIQHDGYRIAAEVQINRMREGAEMVSFDVFANQARQLPNTSDRAYVLMIIASVVKGAAERRALIAEARQIADSDPVFADKIDFYETASSRLSTIDDNLGRQLIREGMRLATSVQGSTTAERRRSFVERAYRLDPEFAASFASAADDDPARQRIEKQLNVLRLRDQLSEKQRRGGDVVRAKAIDYSKAAWLQLARLVSSRATTTDPRKTLPYLDYAAKQPIVDAYPIFAWVIENAVRRRGSADEVRRYILPLYEACLRGAELAIRTASKLNPLMQRPLQFDVEPGSEQKKEILIRDGERGKAILFISEWVLAHSPSALYILDPYFKPRDLDVLRFVREANPACEVLILTSKEAQKRVPAPYEDSYRSAWRDISDQDPPPTTIVISGTERSGKFPVHDRWWLTETGGLYIGTSVGGLGARVASISTLFTEQAAAKRTELASYFAQTRREFDGERLLYSTIQL